MSFRTVARVAAVAGGLLAACATPGLAATLENVRADDRLRCGINPGLAGFSYTDERGRWTGFEAAYCRALAAAVLGDPDKVSYVTLTGKTRFPALASGEVHVLSRNTTWTFSRDVDLGFTFVGINYYDRARLHRPQGAWRRERHRARRRLDLHPDRHHHRAQPRGLHPRQRDRVRAGAARDQRRGPRGLRGGALRRLHDGTFRAWRQRNRPSTTRTPTRSTRRSSRRSRWGLWSVTATTGGRISGAGS